MAEWLHRYKIGTSTPYPEKSQTIHFICSAEVVVCSKSVVLRATTPAGKPRLFTVKTLFPLYISWDRHQWRKKKKFFETIRWTAIIPELFISSGAHRYGRDKLSFSSAFSRYTNSPSAKWNVIPWNAKMVQTNFVESYVSVDQYIKKY